MAPLEKALFDALEDVLVHRNINAKSFGYWARRVNGVHIGGFLLKVQHDPSTNANVFTVHKM